MRSTYDAESNYRHYANSPLYPMPNAYQGREITEDTEFDEVRITCSPEERQIGRAWVYQDDIKGSQVPALSTPAGSLTTVGRMRYFRDDPEVQIIRKRIREGACEVKFVDASQNDYVTVLSADEMHAAHWLLDLLHPFHADDRDLFFQHLTEDLSYTAPERGDPQRFTFPGIVEGASRRYYRREDSVGSPPDVSDAEVATLAAAGWTPDVPYGPHQVYAVDVLDAPGAVSVSGPHRVQHRRKDVTAAIVAIARVWHRYWRSLTSSEQGINVRMTMRKHVEHAIGRLWAEKPHAGAIDVFHEGQTGARERTARDAEDSMLGDQERWALDRGYAALALALNEGGNRTALESQLGDYTFCHLNPDGTVADRLSNGADGITEATWNAYQSTHYPAALRHGVDTLAGESVAITVEQGATETGQIEATGGLAPFVFAMVGSSTWLSVSDTGLVTASPDATVAARAYTGFATVTDALGTVVQVEVVVTVTAPASE